MVVRKLTGGSISSQRRWRPDERKNSAFDIALDGSFTEPNYGLCAIESEISESRNRDAIGAESESKSRVFINEYDRARKCPVEVVS